MGAHARINELAGAVRDEVVRRYYREDLPVLGDWDFNLRFLARRKPLTICGEIAGEPWAIAWLAAHGRASSMSAPPSKRPTAYSERCHAGSSMTARTRSATPISTSSPAASPWQSLMLRK